MKNCPVKAGKAKSATARLPQQPTPQLIDATIGLRQKKYHQPCHIDLTFIRKCHRSGPLWRIHLALRLTRERRRLIVKGSKKVSETTGHFILPLRSPAYGFHPTIRWTKRWPAWLFIKVKSVFFVHKLRRAGFQVLKSRVQAWPLHCDERSTTG